MNRKKWRNLGCIFTLLVTVALPLSFFIPLGATRCGHGPEVRVRSELQNIIIALKGYCVEYNHSPLELFPTDESRASEVKGQLLICLMGKRQHPSNPRDISFLEAKPAYNGKAGIHMPEVGVPVFADPWGQPYYLLMDHNEDGKILNPARGKRVSRSKEIEPETLELEVIAFSAGPDGKVDTWDDNIVSWR